VLLRLGSIALAGALGLSGCGEETESAIPDRPVSTARIQILEPTPNQVTGTDVAVRISLTGGREVEPAEGPLRPGEGRIHVFLDGQLAATGGTDHRLSVPQPGPHSVQVEFMATDQLPFRNRVIAAVLFTVEP
jgi:hypothetical protein